MLCEALEVGIQSVEAAVPELLEPTRPFVDGTQSPRVETIEALFAHLARRDESYFAQHTQMLRRLRLRHAETLGEIGNRSLAIAQQGQDLPTSRLGNRIERI